MHIPLSLVTQFSKMDITLFNNANTHAKLEIIRRWHLRDQVPLREIARRLGISRNTVRRYIRAETIEPAYADRRPRSSLDKYTLKLSAWLLQYLTRRGV
ncbi:transcriptional regulator with sigma factor-related N-terminal domain containing protein [Herbaspirillum sp. CF444]|nr:transcriptional regulator with sigma factor-related N-terminal domain containing protein [Herbaspirillum sp. CF444]